MLNNGDLPLKKVHIYFIMFVSTKTVFQIMPYMDIAKIHQTVYLKWVYFIVSKCASIKLIKL